MNLYVFLSLPSFQEKRSAQRLNNFHKVVEVVTDTVCTTDQVWLQCLCSSSLIFIVQYYLYKGQTI